jgi:phosphoglycerol geranylgeranyltransferase
MLLSKLQQDKAQGHKSWAILIDPDKTDEAACLQLLHAISNYPPDFFFVGSSLLLSNENLQKIVGLLKSNTQIPVLLFPGSYTHLAQEADAVLFLSLISGRNPDYLIGNQVLAAPLLKKYGLEVISTGYMLIDGGKQTSVSYISNTTPIPADKPDIAVCTALAGQYLGLQVLYLEAGSGAILPVSAQMIKLVSKETSIPLIVGGGIKNAEDFEKALCAGADVVVTGNILEKNPALVADFWTVLQKFKNQEKTEKNDIGTKK